MNKPAARILTGCMLFWLATTSPQGATNISNGQLFFRNGDRLSGQLEAILPGTGIRWKHPDAIAGAEFEPSAISEIHLPAVPETPIATSNHCNIYFANQDSLQGDLISFDGEKAVLSTWYAGTLSIPRSIVQSIVPSAVPKPPLFEGPQGLDGWTMGKVNAAALQGVESGEWNYKNGSFYATKSASIARDVKLPDVASIQFDLAWNGFFHLAIALYTSHLQPVNLSLKDSEPDFGGFYSLQFNTYYANLIPIKKLDPLRYLGQASLPTLNQKNSAHVDIRVSKPKQSVALLVDGVLIKEWIDAESFAGSGTAVRFVHQGQGSVRLNHIKVSEWDGQFEEKSALTNRLAQDLARLRNGDKVAGKLQEVREGKVTMAGTEPTLSIPMQRIRAIDFATAATPPTQIQSNAVRAFFPNGGTMRFQLEKWTPTEMQASTPELGKITLKPTAFSKLVFDP